MPSFSLTGKDTAVIAGLVLVDVADGDWLTCHFEQDIAAVRTGKDGNSIFALNTMGQQATVEVRVLRGSVDDKALDSLLRRQQRDFASFQLLDGQFVKRVGDGSGNVTSDTYRLAAGVFQRQVDSKSNAEGDTEQSVSVYRIIYANGARALF